MGIHKGRKKCIFRTWMFDHIVLILFFNFVEEKGSKKLLLQKCMYRQTVGLTRHIDITIRGQKMF